MYTNRRSVFFGLAKVWSVQHKVRAFYYIEHHTAVVIFTGQWQQACKNVEGLKGFIFDGLQSGCVLFVHVIATGANPLLENDSGHRPNAYVKSQQIKELLQESERKVCLK